jgi:hypothetical protein
MLVKPVMLLPGRFKLATRPISTGSVAVPKTIGMVSVNGPNAVALDDHGNALAQSVRAFRE